jgi:hypothetical protein
MTARKRFVVVTVVSPTPGTMPGRKEPDDCDPLDLVGTPATRTASFCISLGIPGDRASGELGVTCWHSKRFRATFKYVVNHFGQGSGANATFGALTSPW